MTVRTLLWLVGSHLQRLLREGMIQRALGFPVAVVGATLLGTLLIVGILRGTPVVVSSEALPANEVAALAQAGLGWRLDPDPERAVVEDRAVLGIGPTTWWSRQGRDAVRAESVLRKERGAAWRPEVPALPGPEVIAGMGWRISSLLLAIYTLYGVVFGAGMVARDRDQGTLEVELALAIPRWIHGAARWVAASLVLGVWVGIAVAFTAAWVGLSEVGDALRVGLAASSTSVAIGLAAVGRAGLNAGFAVPLAAALSVTTGLFGLGYAAPTIGEWLPVASVVAGGSGWFALAIAGLSGAGAIALFTARAARP